jgi:hypothetical protein
MDKYFAAARAAAATKEALDDKQRARRRRFEAARDARAAALQAAALRGDMGTAVQRIAESRAARAAESSRAYEEKRAARRERESGSGLPGLRIGGNLFMSIFEAAAGRGRGEHDPGPGARLQMTIADIQAGGSPAPTAEEVFRAAR